MTNNFYAILVDGSVRKINLIQAILEAIRNIFIDNGNLLKEDSEEIEFDGNYSIQENEILFVNMDLPENVREVISNPIGIPVLDLNNEKIKTLFWYEEGIFYFQNFDNRKLLKNKNVLFYDNQTYSLLTENAFIIENTVNAIHQDGKFYFPLYSNANKIFSLANFYQEATNQEIDLFSANPRILLNADWFKNNSNTLLRKQITLIQKSEVLDTANTKEIQSHANKFALNIELDATNRIVFPEDKKVCKEILIFLNEQYFIGLITGNTYKTNSKRKA